MIEPYYQIFKEKLKEVKFKDMKILFPTWIIVSNCLRQRWSYD
jgi:hypothetical protein